MIIYKLVRGAIVLKEELVTMSFTRMVIVVIFLLIVRTAVPALTTRFIYSIRVIMISPVIVNSFGIEIAKYGSRLF